MTLLAREVAALQHDPRAEDVAADVADEVRALLRSRALLAPESAALPEDLRLGSGGLGLDSISLVEILLDCEQKFGIPPLIELLEGAPLTVGRLVSAVCAASRMKR
jgi:acyl carrier protein